MRKILTAVLGLAIVASANAAELTLWAATTPDNVGEVPVAAPGDVLNLYAEVASGDIWQGIGFDMGSTGTPLMDAPAYFGGFVKRWTDSADFGPQNSPSDVGLLAFPGVDGGASGLGGGGDINGGGIIGSTANGNLFLLGTITVLEDTGVLTATTVGFARLGAVPGEDTINVGADSFLSDAFGSTATLWTPEPASLVLIALAGLAIRRR
jgi:hypothetical protein